MKFNQKYVLRKMAGESLLVSQGVDGIDMTRVIALNSSGAFLYMKFNNHDFSLEDLINSLANEYSIDIHTATCDVTEWIKTLRKYNALDD